MAWHKVEDLQGRLSYEFRLEQHALPLAVLTRIEGRDWALSYVRGSTLLHGLLIDVKREAQARLGI